MEVFKPTYVFLQIANCGAPGLTECCYWLSIRHARVFNKEICREKGETDSYTQAFFSNENDFASLFRILCYGTLNKPPLLCSQ